MQTAEIVGTSPIKITDTVINAAANKALKHYTKDALKKTISTSRKQMDSVAEQYFNLYDELERLCDMYLSFSQQHQLLDQELNIRGVLKVYSRKLNMSLGTN